MLRPLLDNHKELMRGLSQRLSVAVAVWLAVGLAFSAFVIWAFAEVTGDVVEGESNQFDQAALVWIHSNLPGWLNGPMRLVTALGYYWVVLLFLIAVDIVFYRKGWKLSAVLLAVSTTGGALLTTFLKAVFQRARPEIFDSGYTASFYSFPSGHATVAVGFYGALTLILAWRLAGWRRWAIAGLGILLVLLIGFSRLYLGVHYPTDVIAGYLAATLWVGTVGVVLFLWRVLRRRSRNVARSGEP